MAIGKFNMKKEAGQILLSKCRCEAVSFLAHCPRMGNDIIEMWRQFSNNYFSGKLRLFELLTTSGAARLSGDQVMAKTRSDQMVERLRNLQAAAPDIEASAVVSVDGLIMASALQQGVEEDRVSAMSAAMLSLGERISGELGRGGLEQVFIKGDKGAIVLTAIGEEAVLTAMARQDAKLGMYLLEMRRAAEDLVKLVG